MEFTTKTVKCSKAGLSQEEALAGLYEAYGDVRVASIKRKGDAWIAEIQQKIAEFPPPKSEGGGGDEGGAPDTPEDAPEGPPSEDGGDSDPTDGPPSPDGPPGADGGDDKGKAGEHQILHLLHEIAQALGVGGPADTLAPGDEPGLGGPPPGPGADAGMDAGGPPGGAPHHMPTKLKPGEVLPTQTPIGSPAFSSVQKVATQTVQSGVVNPKEMSPSQAVNDLQRQFTGYKVKDLYFDRESSTYRALLSIH